MAENTVEIKVAVPVSASRVFTDEDVRQYVADKLAGVFHDEPAITLLAAGSDHIAVHTTDDAL